MHLSEVPVSGGTKLSVGDQVALGGHSGYATGSHTHMAPKRVRMGLLRGYRDRDLNEAGGTFDPEPYWNGIAARNRYAPASAITTR